MYELDTTDMYNFILSYSCDVPILRIIFFRKTVPEYVYIVLLNNALIMKS